MAHTHHSTRDSTDKVSNPSERDLPIHIARLVFWVLTMALSYWVLHWDFVLFHLLSDAAKGWIAVVLGMMALGVTLTDAPAASGNSASSPDVSSKDSSNKDYPPVNPATGLTMVNAHCDALGNPLNMDLNDVFPPLHHQHHDHTSDHLNATHDDSLFSDPYRTHDPFQ